MKERYQQEFSRVLNVFENVLIALSCNSPASSVFIIVPVVFAGFGAATFLCFVVAAVICAAMALCWAELGAAYPFTGGDYAIVARVLGPSVGFANFCLNTVTGIAVLAMVALGLAEYLRVVIQAEAKVVGTCAVLVAALVATLKIRWGAAITGAFLTVELVALAIVAYLGFAQIHRPFGEMLRPLVFDASGAASAASFSLIMAGAAVANFSYDGFRNTVFLSEEMKVPGATVARAAILALSGIVVAQIIPITAVLLGATSIAELGKAPNLTAFVLERGGPILNTSLSLAVAAAIFNALIAILVVCARMLYSSARDHAWPQPLSRWLSHVHPRLRTPWIATLTFGSIAALITPFSDINALGTFLGAIVTVAYMMIAVAAIVSRLVHRDRHRPYRMPLWPLPPLMALAMMAYIVTQQEARYLWTTFAVAIVSLAYYLFYVGQQPGRRWVMKEAPDATPIPEPIQAPD